MKISIIAAVDEKRGIGKGNRLLWHIPEDFKRFKDLTMGHTIIMGRKTFESIGKPLPNRTNIIITRNTDYRPTGVDISSCIEDAISLAKANHETEVFICGGGEIYKQTIGFADKLYLTVVEGDFNADTFFPDYSDFKVISEEKAQSNGYRYTFLKLEKKNP